MALWVTESNGVKLGTKPSENDVQSTIQAVYRQVLGNAHVMESDRLTSAESMLRNGDITVRGFVRMVAQSDLYRSLFFENASQYRFIEVNYKHFLGRAPQDQSEISEHVQIYANHGYEAEIDSYIGSDEYLANFGEDTVPYARGTQTQAGIKNVGFNRTFALMRGASTSDRSNQAKLIRDLASNLSSKIVSPVGGGAVASTSKRFRISVAKSNFGSRNTRGNSTFEVSYDQMSQKIQNIQKTGGKILSITEVS